MTEGRRENEKRGVMGGGGGESYVYDEEKMRVVMAIKGQTRKR